MVQYFKGMFVLRHTTPPPARVSATLPRSDVVRNKQKFVDLVVLYDLSYDCLPPVVLLLTVTMETA